MADKNSFWSELRSRHVVRAAVAHIVFFWLLAQVAETALPYLGIVDDPVRWAVVAGVALLPVTLIIAWFFEHPWHRYTSGRVALDIAIIAVIAASALLWAVRNLPQVVHARNSVVILPFDFRAGDHGAESLSRALAYEVNGLLLRSGSVDVMASESANSRLLEGMQITGVADLLDVQHLLTGAILSAGDPFRVSVRLLDRTGSALWSSEFEDTLENLYRVQERIAEAVESQLGTTAGAKPLEQVASMRCPMPKQQSALERYYTARHFVEARTESEQSVSEQHEAARLYEGLIAEFPDFAQARSGLAWALRYLVTYDPANQDREANFERSLQLAAEAVELCPTLGEALVLLPNEADHPNFWINEEQNLALWIELQPEATENYQKYSHHLQSAGRTVEAIAVAHKNYALNPLSVRTINELSARYIYAGRFDEAIELYDRAVQLGSTGPDYARNNRQLQECGEQPDCVIGLLPPPFHAFADQFRIMLTEPATPMDAERSVEAGMQIFRSEPMSINILNTLSCRGDHLTPLFFRLWEGARDDGVFWYWPNVWLPECSNIWKSPEFADFADEVGLVEYWRAKGWADACEPAGMRFACSQEIFDRKRNPDR